MWDCARRECGAGLYISNNDHCNSYGNLSGDYYSDQVWVIFNHIYDVQQGIRFVNAVHCSTSTTCCCGGTTSCCSTVSPQYGDSRMYAVGNIIHQVRRFSGSDSAAIVVGPQVQARVANNTIYKCNQGVHVNCTHSSGECPPGGDTSSDTGKTRNTRVLVMNNLFLDMVNNDTDDAHVYACTGPYFGNSGYPFTLTNYKFDRNMHYGNIQFTLPSGSFDTVAELDGDTLTNYGETSHDEDDPELDNAAALRFDLTVGSPDYMSTNGVRDDAEAYDDFEAAFPEFPEIFHDYVGEEYSDNICAMGAYKGD